MSEITKLNVNDYIGKTDGSEFHASTWNAYVTLCANKMNELVDAVNSGSGGGSTPTPTPTEEKFYVNGTLTAPTSGKVALTAGSTYVLSGVLTGQIVIGSSTDTPTDDTFIILKGVTIKTASTDNAAVMYMPNAQTLQITVAKNTENYIVCSNVAAIADSQKGAIWSEKNMIIQGNGYLALKNLGGHGIKASELRISGNPHIYVDAKHDGIHGNSSIDIDGGIFYITNANDAFGTRAAEGDKAAGVIRIFGGSYYVYGIAQQVFDSKGNGYIFRNFTINTDVTATNLYNNMTIIDPKVYFGSAVQDTTNGGYSTQPSGTVKCYAVDADGNKTGEAEVITPTDGTYTLTKKVCVVEGYITGKLSVNIQTYDIELKNTYLEGEIVYTATKKKLQVNVEKGNIGIVTGNITSGSNLATEVKSGGYLIVDGNVSGDELTFNDSKGVAIVEGNVVGKEIYIGTDKDTSGKKLQGALIVKGTLSAILNSKFTKGWVHVLSSGLTGMLYADKVSAAGYAELKSDNVFYHKSNGAILGSRTIEVADYVAV